MVDASGFPLPEGGICATLRDCARFGLMCLQDGAIGGRQIVPADWLGRLLVPDAELVAAYGASKSADPATPPPCTTMRGGCTTRQAASMSLRE